MEMVNMFLVCQKYSFMSFFVLACDSFDWSDRQQMSGVESWLAGYILIIAAIYNRQSAKHYCQFSSYNLSV